MAIDRIEVFVTDLPTRLRRERVRGTWDTGDPPVPEPSLLIESGQVSVPDRPGLGVTIDEGALKKLTLRTEVVPR